MSHKEHTHQGEEESNPFTKRADKMQSIIDKINTKANLIQQQTSVHRADMMEATEAMVEIINQEIHEWQHIVDSQKQVISDKNAIIEEYGKELRAKDVQINYLKKKLKEAGIQDIQFIEAEIVEAEVVEDDVENTEG